MQVNFEAAFGSPSVSSQNSSFGTSEILQPERVGGPPPPVAQSQPLKPVPLGSSVDQGLASTVQQLSECKGVCVVCVCVCACVRACVRVCACVLYRVCAFTTCVCLYALESWLSV